MPGTVLTAAIVIALAAKPECGADFITKDVSPAGFASRLAGVAEVESAYHPFAIGVNGPGGRTIFPETIGEAIATARVLLAEGRSIDLGLMQINSANLERHGLTLENVFDACTNLRAGAKHLAEDYEAAWQFAHSRYNTGKFESPVGQKYAEKVARAMEGKKAEAQTETIVASNACPAQDSFRVRSVSCAENSDSWRVRKRD